MRRDKNRNEERKEEERRGAEASILWLAVLGILAICLLDLLFIFSAVPAWICRHWQLIAACYSFVNLCVSAGIAVLRGYREKHLWMDALGNILLFQPPLWSVLVLGVPLALHSKATGCVWAWRLAMTAGCFILFLIQCLNSWQSSATVSVLTGIAVVLVTAVLLIEIVLQRIGLDRVLAVYGLYGS